MIWKSFKQNNLPTNSFCVPFQEEFIPTATQRSLPAEQPCGSPGAKHARAQTVQQFSRPAVRRSRSTSCFLVTAKARLSTVMTLRYTKANEQSCRSFCPYFRLSGCFLQLPFSSIACSSGVRLWLLGPAVRLRRV